MQNILKVVATDDIFTLLLSVPFFNFFFIASSGNTDVMTEISDSLDFNYIHILRLLYSKDSLVRLLAGGALAAFSYNNLGQQQEIEESGGVRHHCFVPFLESSDEFYRSNAAFQVS